MKHFFSKADYLFAIFSSLKISVEVTCVQTSPLTGYVEETSCTERPTSLKGREKEGPWCRLYYGPCSDQVNS